MKKQEVEEKERYTRKRSMNERKGEVEEGIDVSVLGRR
jgi:hypothetical protein